MPSSSALPGADELFSVRDRVVVVTGASSGLGHRFARLLAANGANVVAVARRLDRLEQLEVESSSVMACRADLAIESERSIVVDRTVERFGRIDVLVNNAGYGEPVKAVDEPIEDFRAVLEVNLVAAFELARLSARHMIEQGSGSIINIASILGLVASAPLPNASYTASKGALVQLTRELGCQWARKGVRVNAIAPGFFPTEATGDFDEAGLGEHIRRNCPVGRPGDPGELDGVMLFLASDASTYCTGQTITVDGGWTAR